MEVHIHDTLIFVALHSPCAHAGFCPYTVMRWSVILSRFYYNPFFITVINPGFNLGQGCPLKQYFFKQH